MQSRFALVLILIFSVTPAFAKMQEEGHKISSADKDFITYAAQDNHAEIEACLLAENRAADDAVKAFTRLMVDDHVQIASRLAAMTNVEGTEAPNGVGEEGQKTLSELKEQPAGKFDRQFMQHQIKDHEHDLQRFKEIQSQTENSRLKQFASETYPILQQHLALAKAVEELLGAQSRRASK